jgi:hypothetical protein
VGTVFDPSHNFGSDLDAGVFIALWSIVSSSGVVESIRGGVVLQNLPAYEKARNYQ